jgi:hypothetical protein
MRLKRQERGHDWLDDIEVGETWTIENKVGGDECVMRTMKRLERQCTTGDDETETNDAKF